MRYVIVTVLMSLAPFTACGGKDANTQICLEEYAQFKDLNAKKDEAAREKAGLVYQSCGISCDIVQDADACAAFKDVTTVICDKEGQEACKTLCEGTNGKKNETACALVK